MQLRPWFARATFWPSLAWERACAALLPGRRWWDGVDDVLVVGGLPTSREARALFGQGVRGVVNACAEHEGPTVVYRELGMRHLHLPTVDYTVPTRDALTAALGFIASTAERDERVYLHCKAGRGRAPTIALCWLMRRHGLDPAGADDRIRSRRGHVDRDLPDRDVVRRFYADGCR